MRLYLSMLESKEKITKRIITLKHSDSALTSKRVRIILSSPEDSENLTNAVRALRHKDEDNSKFKLTPRTKDRIDKEARKLHQA